MSGAMTAATTDEWMQQLYGQQQQQPLMDAMVPIMEGFSDATVVTTTSSPTLSSEGTTNYYNSYSSSNNNCTGQLNPKAHNNALKPIRRRSRASKKTPTTLLNANTTNFRELVQQFTGCSSTSTAMPFSLFHKGPITLNFQQGSTQQQIQHSTSNYNYNQVLNYNHNHHHHHHVAVPIPWQKQLPEQVPMQQSGSVPISDGLVMVNDFGFHELTVNNVSFSNDIIKNHDGYFM